MMTSQTKKMAYPGLYIGGLRNDLHPAKLAGLVSSLLSRFQVQVPKHSVRINFKDHEAFTIIDLPDLSTSQRLLAQLSSLDNVHNVFDLRKITLHPSAFIVGPRLTKKTRFKSRSRSRPNRKTEAERSAALSESASSTSQKSSSNHSIDNAERCRPRSTSDLRNGRERPGVSDQVADTVETSKRPSSRGRGKTRKSRSGSDQATSSLSSSSHAATDSQSKTRQQQSQTSHHAFPHDCTLSDSENESSPDAKDGSSSSELSRESESTVNDSGTGVLYPGVQPQAGGVRRLLHENSVDPVFKSMSDRGIHPPHSKTNATTSTTGLPVPSQVSTTTSTPGAAAGLVSNFYRQGQTIGRETRHSEFKQGGKVNERPWLVETVGKYVCGFLNSSEGGTLYIGVNDEGIATGVACPQAKEDDMRLLIDEALKSIDPPIFTDMYSVRFVPLMESNGRISDSLQVLEVEVKEIRNLNQLYVFRNNAFLRRDGSLQGPLKARQVQEWMRMRLERENSSTVLKQQLHQMTSQLEREQERTARMRDQLTELESYVSEVKLERKKSRICAIM